MLRRKLLYFLYFTIILISKCNCKGNPTCGFVCLLVSPLWNLIKRVKRLILMFCRSGCGRDCLWALFCSFRGRFLPERDGLP